MQKQQSIQAVMGTEGKPALFCANLTLPPSFAGCSSCCFTGHRPVGLPCKGDERSREMDALKHVLLEVVRQAVDVGVTTFLTGGAEGFDTLAAEAVLAWKRFEPAIQLHLVLPNHTPAEGRAPEEILRFEKIAQSADKIYYASACSTSARALLQRNRMLVEHADCCIAYQRKAAGGTLYTVNYAMNFGIPVLNLYKAVYESPII